MATFAEIIKRVHLINDHILADMTSEKKDYSEELSAFRTRLMTTKDWFSRISWANKKRFVLALLDDVKSVWTLSLLLKSIWNCRPKDAVVSVCQPRTLSSYDQVPMDHNRTALPLTTLKEVMTKDRRWFLSLEPEPQAVFLAELLMISGGPIMWEVLQNAQTIYDDYLEQQLEDLQNCNAVVEAPVEKKPAPETGKKDQSTPRKSSFTNEPGRPLPGQAQKELDAALASWNSNIKSIRDRMKLEEIEMVFNDGSRKRVWKVNRPKPEATETVDFVQLLPSEIAKKIFVFLPTAQLADCARVNKYWSYLVDELRSELNARQKINIELEKLKDNMVRHDASLNLLSLPEFHFPFVNSSASVTQFSRARTRTSAQTNAFSFRLVSPKKKKARSVTQKPIRNLADFNERLERRGAADENIWAWCENVLNDDTQIYEAEDKKETEGLICLDSGESFPCPLMKENFNVPLKLPLLKDPVQSAPVKPTGNISGGDNSNHNLKQGQKRYSLWSKDMSGLYPVCKLPSYQFS